MSTKNRKRKINKLKIIVTVIILIATIYLGAGVIIGETEPTIDVVCKDYNLYQALKNNILSKYLITDMQNQPNDQNNYILKVKISALPSITSLNLSGNSSGKITDVSGIENFEYLEELDLNTNNISNITPIANLTKLKTLDLSKNNITDISKLSYITSLQSLNLSTNKINDIESLATLTNLTSLNLSVNSINRASAIQSLNKLENLDLSSNSGFANMDEALVPSLKALNLSNTAIKRIDYDQDSSSVKLYSCKKLIDLRLADCKVTDINLLFKTEKDATNNSVAIMKQIEVLDLSGTGITNFTNLKLITSLKELYMKNNGITSITGVYDLDNLEYLNVDNNKIKDLNGIFKIKTVDDVQTIEKVLNASQLSMKNNQISDISPLGYMSKIEYLDLSENKVSNISRIERFSFEKGLNLNKQTVEMNVYKKSIQENQYIILYNLFQATKDSKSKAYDPNSYFETSGCEINQEERYSTVPYINFIVTPDKTVKDEITITIHGGVADSSVLNIKLSTSTSAIDSVVFEDENLDKCIYEDLVDRQKSSEYIARAPFIINVSRSMLTSIKDLQLIPETGYEIKNLKGLDNFSNLEILNLSDNKISDDSVIKNLTKLKILNLSNNELNNNYTCIENLYSLTNLNLIGNNIKDLNSLQKFTENITNAKKKILLTDLSLTDNQISDISALANIGTLVNVYIANNNISDITPLAQNTKINILDISGNEIIDISTLSGLPSLQTLNASNNIIRDITPLTRLQLYTLNISSNRVSDISPLANKTTLITLNINNNKIEDISPIETLLLRNEFSARQQKIAKSIPTGSTGVVEIELPKIFLSSRDSNSKVYSSSEYDLDNCTLSNDGKKILVDSGLLKNKIAKVRIVGGNGGNTTLSIANVLASELKYSEQNKTNKDVTVTISFNKQGVTVLNNDGKTTYTFKENGEFTFEYVDEEGFDGSKTAEVNWIDKTAPEATVDYNEVNDKIEVTITANEPIKDVSGWQFATADKTTIKKSFGKKDNDLDVVIKDEAGNETSIRVEISKQTQAKIETSKYVVDSDNNVTKISPNTKVSDIKKNITSSGKIRVLNTDSKEISNTAVVGTGYKVEVTIEEQTYTYELVVRGDLNGDGKVTLADLSLMNQVLVGKTTLNGVKTKAADINYDSNRTLSDLSLMNQAIVKKYTL